MERAKEHEMVETRDMKLRLKYQLITLAFERLLIEERERKRYNSGRLAERRCQESGEIYVDVP